jgi:hypothetical protein
MGPLGSAESKFSIHPISTNFRSTFDQLRRSNARNVSSLARKQVRMGGRRDRFEHCGFVIDHPLEIAKMN